MFAIKLLLLFPFLLCWIAEGVMWLQNLLVQYQRDAQCFTPVFIVYIGRKQRLWDGWIKLSED